MKKIFFTTFTALVISICSSVQAFDTGDHTDLTRQALLAQGFNQDARDIAVVENFLVDYYTSQPITGLTGQVSQKELDKLHFDNLTTTSAVRNYWDRLTINTHDAVQAAARANNPRKILALMSYSLHAVQDFYTHSNWADLLGTAPYLQTRTYFNSPENTSNALLRTGKYPNSDPIVATDHGEGKSVGLNHDNYNRINWMNAYSTAYSASRQWVYALETWVNEINPNLWAQVRNFSQTADDRLKIATENEFTYKLATYLGHWKGLESKDIATFATVTAGFISSPDSSATANFKQQGWYKELTGATGTALNLSDNTPVNKTVPSVPFLELRQKALIVRTVSVSEDEVGTFEQKIDSPGGTADFYAKISIDGQTFIEAMQLNQKSIRPNWASVKFVADNVASSSVKYELWDDDFPSSADDLCDINALTGQSGFQFSFDYSNGSMVGQGINGKFNTQASVFKSKGNEKDRANIQFFAYTSALDRPKNPAATSQATQTQPSQTSFQKMPGAALDIGIGANNAVWVIGTDQSAYQWNGSSWVNVPSSELRRIAVDPQGNPWVLNIHGDIYRRINNNWQLMPGKAEDIGIGADGSVWVTGFAGDHSNGFLFKWNGTDWVMIQGLAVNLAVEPNGNPWGVDSNGQIARYIGGVKKDIAGEAKDIAIGANATVLVIGGDATRIWRYTGTDWAVQGQLAGANRIASDTQGTPWIVTDKNEIYRGTPASATPAVAPTPTPVVIAPSAPTVQDYTIKIFTGDKSGAGTDSNIRLSMQGTKNSISNLLLNPLISGNAFERNQTDTIIIRQQPIIGELLSISISSDDKFLGSAWYLGWIEISGSGMTTRRFTYNDWIEKPKLTITLR